jgi:hypothetical protein
MRQRVAAQVAAPLTGAYQLNLEIIEMSTAYDFAISAKVSPARKRAATDSGRSSDQSQTWTRRTCQP